MQGYSFVLRLTLVISLSLLVMIGAQAQNNVAVRANVSKFTGRALLYPNSKSKSGPLTIGRNTQLEPENVIETGYNSRVVISLSDGSWITVLPKSRVILKNFRAPQSARELLEIQYGRVIVKIHHPPGQSNPYSLTSPAASIAVRGTEFSVDVRRGGETLVFVREGLVEVWPRDNPSNKRLVAPGYRVTIQPGGRISSLFPGPQRSLESVRQSSSGISNAFFSAFPDQHLDSLDNPAYADEFKDDQGRFILLPSVSPSYSFRIKDGILNLKKPPEFDYDVPPQMTFFTPIPGSRLVVGGGVFAFRTRNQKESNYESSDYLSNNREAKKLNALNASVIAAYSLGENGKTSVGIGIDRLSGQEVRSSDYYSELPLSKERSYSYSNAHIASTRLTLGITRRLSESAKIGLYYRHGFGSSDQEYVAHQERNDMYAPSLSYLRFGIAKISESSSSSELGVRLRGAMTRRLFYGAQASYVYERVRRLPEKTDASVSYYSYLKRRASLGLGFGFLLTSRVLLNFDLGAELSHSGNAFEGLAVFGQASPSSVVALDYSSGGAAFAHVAAQATPWRNFILSTSFLQSYQRDVYAFNDSGSRQASKYGYSNKAYNIGLGWKFTPNLITEYVTSYQFGYRAPSHAVRLRYTFNLGIINEK